MWAERGRETGLLQGSAAHNVMRGDEYLGGGDS